MNDSPITPYLPPTARNEIAAWKASGRTAFIRAATPLPNVQCKNCADLGYVYVTFCRAGPMKRVPGSGIAVYYDGGADAGKGWYVVDHTKAFACPHCGIAAQEAR